VIISGNIGHFYCLQSGDFDATALKYVAALAKIERFLAQLYSKLFEAKYFLQDRLATLNIIQLR